jgi:hypothetical protein
MIAEAAYVRPRLARVQRLGFVTELDRSLTDPW